MAVLGRRWYRFQDGFAAIAHACLPDSDDARKVAYFAAREAAGRLVPSITLTREDLDTGPNYRLTDGNHRAVAIFELRRARADASPSSLLPGGRAPLTRVSSGRLTVGATVRKPL